ncbi:uncharacterized protein LOC142317848 [Lycorma delicatula]|uniref:uncharacterized protein LOC142317848 n=1 Tax=Lycorma delicatula TaxID=130591 RepID=UPI003F50EBA3
MKVFLKTRSNSKEKCVGQGYDGCSSMAGKDGGVQKIIREKYTRALYFHCASHKLNLVLNDLNKITMIRNACTIERSFSTLRRVKTWLRSTMRKIRLAGLCMMNQRDLNGHINIIKSYEYCAAESNGKLQLGGGGGSSSNGLRVAHAQPL